MSTSRLKRLAEQAPEVKALLDEIDRLRADNSRLRDILIADGLNPDAPIPPGLALENARLRAELAARGRGRVGVRLVGE